MNCTSKLPLVSNEPTVWMKYCLDRPADSVLASLRKGIRRESVTRGGNQAYQGTPESEYTLCGRRSRSEIRILLELQLIGKIKEGDSIPLVYPASYRKTLATVHQANKDLVNRAIKSSLLSKKEWQALPFDERAAVFLKAADLISTKYRYDIVAATMLGQGKNAWQSEIDAAAEVIAI